MVVKNMMTHKTAMELEPEFGEIPDEALASRIGQPDEDSWKILFYLLFGRHEPMLEAEFTKYASPRMDFDDFMLELHVKMGNDNFAAVSQYKGKAKFKTYLSTIARNLLFDIMKRDRPMIDILTVYDLPCSDDDEREKMRYLIDIINSYPDEKVRFVLFKTIEGYQSKEIASMLSERSGKEVKSSYVDTLRSRAYTKLQRKIDSERKRHLKLLHMPPYCLNESVVDQEPQSAHISTDYRYTILPALRYLLNESYSSQYMPPRQIM